MYSLSETPSDYVLREYLLLWFCFLVYSLVPCLLEGLKKGESCKNMDVCGADSVCDAGDVCSEYYYTS